MKGPVPPEAVNAWLNPAVLYVAEKADPAAGRSVGTGSIVTFRLPFAEHPAAVVTVTVSWTGLVVRASKEIEAVPAPAVIVPFVIPHAYVAPAPADGTLAACPVVLAQTADGAVIVATGTGLIGTSIEVEELQLPALVTVSESVTFPETPAV